MSTNQKSNSNISSSIKSVVYDRMNTSDSEIKMLIYSFIAHAYYDSIDLEAYNIRPYIFNKYKIARIVYEKYKIHKSNLKDYLSDDETRQILDIINNMNIDYKSIKVDYICNRLNSISYAMFLLDSLSTNNISSFFGNTFNRISVYSYLKQIESMFIVSFDEEEDNSLISYNKFMTDIQQEEDDENKISSGVRFIDEITRGGFSGGDTITIASRPGSGKSTMCLDIVVKNSKLLNDNQKIVLYISPDMHYKYVYTRYISNHDNVNFQDVVRYIKEGKFAGNIPVMVTESSCIEYIEGIITNYANKLGMVVIDYIQLMHSDNMNAFSRNDQITRSIIRFKYLSRKYNFVLLISSQMNRESDRRGSDNFMLSDLRDSASIEHESDLVMFLKKERDIIKIDVAKNRNGPVGCAQVKFDHNRFRLTEID